MNPEIQQSESGVDTGEVTTLYPAHVDCSVSSNVKCMLHQFVDAAGDKRLIVSMDPGEYQVVYTDEFPAGFQSMRVLSGAVVLEGASTRIDAAEGSVHRLADDRAFVFTSRQFTQVQLTDSRPLDEPEADATPDEYRNRQWVMAMPRPKGPRPPRRMMRVNVVPGVNPVEGPMFS